VDERPIDHGRARVSDGVFWADHIRTLKHDPHSRLAIAREYLPLPAAFREAAIALRALIRARRKSGENAEGLLADLYRLAAQNSLLLDTPYIEGIGPGFNVAESIRRETWERLDMPYRSIGYGKLVLLNKSDRKWLIDAWGEPERHLSAQEFHRAHWESAVAAYREAAARRDEQSGREALVRKADASRAKDDQPSIRHFHTKATGVTMQNADGSSRQKVLGSCRPGEHVLMVHDPRNPYDANAIEIRRSSGAQVGFLPAHVAEDIVEGLARGVRYWAWIAEVTGGEGEKKHRGANLLVVYADSGPNDREIEAYARARLAEDPARPRGGCASSLVVAILSLVVIALVA
jgi:hypothetical protein